MLRNHPPNGAKQKIPGLTHTASDRYYVWIEKVNAVHHSQAKCFRCFPEHASSQDIANSGQGSHVCGSEVAV
jgi:hypothetical protein